MQAKRQLWVCLPNQLNLVFCPLHVMHVTVRRPRGITTLTGSSGADAVGVLFPRHLHLGNLLMRRMREAPDRLKAPEAAVTVHFWAEHS